MKKLMLFLIALIPITLVVIIQMTSTYIEKNSYIALEKIIYVETNKTIQKTTSDDVILEFPAEIYPYSATEREIIYSSSNEDIATVDKNGTIRFKDFGNVTIKATSKKFDYIFDECSFYITDDKPHKLEILNDNSQITLGKNMYIETKIIPNDSKNKNLTYTSSNPNVISVNSAGRVTALSSGEATITVTTYNGISSSIHLNVYVPVGSVELENNQTSHITGTNTSKFPNINVYPFDASNKNVTYSSSDENIATIDNNGNISFSSRGVVTFTATTEDGNHSVKYTIRYTGGFIDNIELDNSSKNITMSYESGKVIPLNLLVSPLDADYSNIEYISSNPNVVEIIDNQAIVKGGGDCYITIRANTGNGYISLKSNIKINRKIETINAENITSTSPTINLSSTFTPNDATETVVYSSSSSLVSILGNKITFKHPGEALVVASNPDENITKEFVVTYKPEDMNFINVDSSSPSFTLNFNTNFSFLLDVNLNMGKLTFEYDDEYLTFDNDYTFKTIKGGNTSVIISDGNKSITVNLFINRTANDFLYTINGESINELLTSKEEAQIDIIFDPEDTTIKTINFKSSDENIATVNNSGLVTFHKAGKVDIDIIYGNITKRLSIESTFHKVKSIELFTLNETNIDYEENKIIGYTLKVLPLDLDPTDVISFEFSNNNVVYTQDKNIYVMGGGNVDITLVATTVNGSISASASLFVNRYVESIEAEDIVVNEKIHTISYTLLPADNTETATITTNSSIATLNNNILTFSNTGTVQVTISTRNCSKTIAISYITQGIATKTVSNENRSFDVTYNDKFMFVYDPNFGDVTYTGYEESGILSLQNNVFSAINGGNVTLTASNGTDNITIHVNVTRYAEEINYTVNGENTSSYITSETTAKIDAVVGPSGVTETNIEFTSSDETIATVDNTGLVTFLKAGNVSIYMSSGFVTNKEVKLESTYGYIKSINTFQLSDVEYQENLELTPTLEVFPSITNLNNVIRYESSNDNVVKVIDGKLIVQGGGNVTIKVIGTTPTSTVEKSVNITVIRYAESIEAEDIVITSPSIKLNYTVSPSDHTDSINISLGSNVATLSNGELTFSNPGTITITLKGEKTDEKIIHVTYKPNDVTFYNISETSKEITIEYNQTFGLMFEDDFGAISYQYDNTHLNLSNNYIFKAIKGGSTIIKASNGNTEIDVTINVKRYATSIEATIDGSIVDSSYLTSKQTVTINITFDSPDVTERNITFVNGNEDVATIDTNGIVTFLKEGTVTITIKVDRVEDLTITIESTLGKLKDFELDISGNIELTTDDLNNMPTYQIEFKDSSFNPSDYTYNSSDFTFSSNFENVATVDSNGLIRAIDKGETIINVTSNNITKTFKVIVIFKTSSVELKFNNEVLPESPKVLGNTLDLDINVYPANVNDSSVTFQVVSGNATIDATTGLVTFQDYNPVQIKVTTNDSNSTVYAITTITRVNAADSITINNSGNDVTNKDIQIEPNYNTNLYFEIIPTITGLLDPNNWDYSNINLYVEDEQGIVPTDENGNKLVEQVFNDTTPTNEFILDIDESKLNKYSRVGLEFGYGNSSKSSVDIYFKDLVSISFELDNADDVDYGLQRKRVFGTLSYINGAEVTTLDVGYTRNPSDNTDALVWTSSDTSLATVNNGIITFTNPWLTGEGKVTISAKSSYDDTLIDSYEYTIVNGLNVYNADDYTYAYNKRHIILHTTLGSGKQVTDANGNTYYEDEIPGKPYQILNDNDTITAGIYTNIYGNGFTLSLANVDFPEKSTNVLLGETYYYTSLSRDLYNVTLRLGNYDANKKYDKAYGAGSGSKIEYSIIECFRHIWVGNSGLNVSNSIFRHNSYAAFQMGNDENGNTYTLALHNTIFYDMGKTAIDLSYGTLKITGFFDVYNFTKPAEFGSTFKDSIKSAYQTTELNDYTYKPSGSSADDWQVNVAILMLPASATNNAKPSASQSSVYFGDSHEDNGVTGLNYKFVETVGTTSINLGLWKPTIKVTIYLITPKLSTSPIQPGTSVDLSKVYRPIE